MLLEVPPLEKKTYAYIYNIYISLSIYNEYILWRVLHDLIKIYTFPINSVAPCVPLFWTHNHMAMWVSEIPTVLLAPDPPIAVV